MKNDIYELLKFRLDSEYEELEFEIIPIPPYDFIQNKYSLEPYEYFGEINEIFGLKVKCIILYYNADILMKVKMIFLGDVANELKQNLELENIFFQDSEIQLKLYFESSKNRTILLYQSRKLMSD